MAAGVQSGYLLNEAADLEIGEAAVVKDFRYIIIYFTTDNVTDGAIIDIESLAPDGTWHTVAQQSITSANPVTPVTFEGAYNQLRANIIVYTDGVYTVTYNTKA